MTAGTITERLTAEQIEAVLEQLATSARMLGAFALQAAATAPADSRDPSSDNFYLIEHLAQRMLALADWAGGSDVGGTNPAHWFVGGQAFRCRPRCET